MKVSAHPLSANGSIPNNPNCPLLVYPQAVAIEGNDPASAFEALFARNGWPPAWRNGVFPFHHYHSTAHEVLGVYSGEVEVCFGGEGGLVLTAKPGDVIVVPAGVGHKRLSMRGSLGIVGAYPEHQDPDMCQAVVGSADRHADTVARVPMPRLDPVCGADGGLSELWT